MEIIINEISHNLNIQQYLKDKNSCFLDIETTGLNRNKQIIYLIGVLYYDLQNNSWILKQYFTNTIKKEADLLNIFIKEISSFTTIITYNGDNFDIPFINHRLKYNNIDNFINKDKSFDLYTIIRNNRKFLDLNNLKLKTIEESLGFYRQDKYSGFDCITFYYEYIKSHDLSLKENIVKHNYDDLIHMLDIIQILDVIDNKKSIYLSLNNNYNKFTIEHLDFSNDILEISLKTSIPFKRNIVYFSKNYSISSKNLVNIKISIDINYAYIAKNKKCAYINVEDYTNIINVHEYNISSNILVLVVEKDYCIKNIKELLESIIKELVYEKIIF